MRVVVSCNRRFNRTPDGVVWTTSSDDHHFWTRYLTVFEEVLVVGRVQDIANARETWKEVGGCGVAVHALPNYVGPLGFLTTTKDVFVSMRSAVRCTDAVILRIPGHVVTSMEMILRWRCQPYGAEVVGGMGSSLHVASTERLLKPLLHLFSVHTLRRQCKNAHTIAYVTASSLQRLFPPSPSAFVTHYSSIELRDEVIADEPRVVRDSTVRLISVGSMEMKYKRFDVLIEAVRRCISDGLNLHLTLVGDGRYRPMLEELASGLGPRVEFLGELPGSDAVRKELLKADLFVSSSASEGLPRVVIEAMAVGLPCIATTVGGTPELLPTEDMVTPGDVEALAARLRTVVADRDLMREMSWRNLRMAREYAESTLSRRRNEMYQYLRECTARYIAAASRSEPS